MPTPGFPGHRHPEQHALRDQDPKAGQEEEDQQGDTYSRGPQERRQCHQSSRRCSRPTGIMRDP
jgi:hypothetical protein